MSEATRAVLTMNAEKYGYEIKDEKRLEVLADKFDIMEEQYGEMYCPCQPNKTEDTICPCRYMCEHNVCRCGLYKVK